MFTGETGEEFDDRHLSELVTREQEIYAQIESIGNEIFQIEQDLNNYPDYSDEYRALLDEQIELLNQQEVLLLELEEIILEKMEYGY